MSNVIGEFKCPTCNQPYVVTSDNKLQVLEHVRKHWKYEHVDEAWLDRHIRPDTGKTTEAQ